MAIDYKELKDYVVGAEGIGNTCLIVCNGPSLKDIPLEFLEYHPTFGTNSIYKFPDFQPTYYTVTGFNLLAKQEQRDEIQGVVQGADICFMNRMWAHHFPYNNIVTVLSRRGKMSRQQKIAWSDDPLDAVGIGFTVTYVQLQIAWYLGYRTALMIGQDHDWAKDTLHFYGDTLDPTQAYDDETLRKGSDFVFNIAKKHYEEGGGKIINLTPGTKSIVLPCEQDWREFYK